jgi:hypothetical protein
MNKRVVVKVENGSAKAYDANGSFLYTVTTGDVISAVVEGDIIAVTKPDGMLELYDANTGAFSVSFRKIEHNF